MQGTMAPGAGTRPSQCKRSRKQSSLMSLRRCASRRTRTWNTRKSCARRPPGGPAYAYETPEMREVLSASAGRLAVLLCRPWLALSDCTAEGLKAVLVLRNQAAIKKHCKPISDERLFKALEVLLTLQNVDAVGPLREQSRVWVVRVAQPI